MVYYYKALLPLWDQLVCKFIIIYYYYVVLSLSLLLIALLLLLINNDKYTKKEEEEFFSDDYTLQKILHATYYVATVTARKVTFCRVRLFLNILFLSDRI